MKKGLKKLTALLCGATLAVSMVGCGTQDAGTTSQTTAEQNNNTTQQTAESQPIPEKQSSMCGAGHRMKIFCRQALICITIWEMMYP